jgi:hypothetical protein
MIRHFNSTTCSDAHAKHHVYGLPGISQRTTAVIVSVENSFPVCAVGEGRIYQKGLA